MNSQLGIPTRHFTVQLSPTSRGARLARLLATEWLRAWGVPGGAIGTAAQLVGELAANAVTHGRVDDRDFLLALRTTDRDRALRIEVTDTCHDRLPSPHRPSAPYDESGRGLLIVDVLADRWGVTMGPVPRKTVWAELDLVPEPRDQSASRHVAPGHGFPGPGGPGGLSKETKEKKEPHQTPPLPPPDPAHPQG
ncbi:ATP-binding protein [Streptomyces sp. SP18CS02]|uniref:ATP-binding protein n=1 Tax=Streptomyces sp. SP18CS02 TaxID=3002531 RepID=UPI002E78DEBD|nr:ATP-binding protein [Streptomyces sp. SP18CS02]